VTSDARYVQRLRDADLRVTQPRIAVLAALDADHGHPDVETLTGAVRDRLGRISTQAVYDILAACSQAGLVRRIAPSGGPARFETRVGDNHHHLVCRSCGSAVDVDCAVGVAPCLEPTDHAGFLLERAEVTYWGLCPACRDTDADTDEQDAAP